jgi:serine/threonine protein kinase/tetratricopeptide (TPR) repeat protein
MRTRIGRYRVDGALGEGGMGVVYAAHDEQLGRDLAVKVLREVDLDPGARERFRREARAAAAVSHPNICHIYDVGEDDGTFYIAMERLEGEPLSARLARGPMSVQEAIPVALGVLGALEALHARGIVHRDLKPANVFLTPHGVKLLDFGLAHGDGAAGATRLNARVTATGLVTGTPHYMAPEQLQGRTVGPVADQFAFGAVLFEMLTARQAFAGATVWEVSHAVLSEPPPALTGGGDVVALDRVIARCLAKAPEDRYPDPAAIARELRALEGTPRPGDPSATIARATTRLMVLPLRLLRPDPDLDFLSFSLSDALIESLAGLGSLVVRSSHAAQRFVSAAAGAVDLDRIAREGQVDAVLTGSLLRAGERVRLAAQLVEAPGGTVLWSKTAEVRMVDVFQLQDELARQVVESLAIPLSARDRRRLGRDVPVNGRAYELFLRANHLAHNTVLREPLTAARELYRASLEEDPDYAPAWARLGRVCRVLAKYSETTDEEHVRRAEEAFQRAFALSPDLPLAHHLYTYFEIEQLGRADAAMTRLLRKVGHTPNDPDLFAGLVVACRYCGLLEASIAAADRARQLDPTLATSVQYSYFLLGDFARVEHHDQEDTRWLTAFVLAQEERLDESLRVFRASQGTVNTVERHFVDALTALAEGRLADVRVLGAAMRATGFRDPEGLIFVSLTQARAGHYQEAIDEVEALVAAGYTCPQLRNLPWLASLSGDPRFEAAIAKAAAARDRANAAFAAANGPRLLGIGA